MSNEEYLGDGAFVSFDGGQFCLRAPRESGDHIVYLDAYALRSLNEYARRIRSDAPALSSQNGK
jgi:hypothetical protein